MREKDSGEGVTEGGPPAASELDAAETCGAVSDESQAGASEESSSAMAPAPAAAPPDEGAEPGPLGALEREADRPKENAAPDEPEEPGLQSPSSAIEPSQSTQAADEAQVSNHSGPSVEQENADGPDDERAHGLRVELIAQLSFVEDSSVAEMPAAANDNAWSNAEVYVVKDTSFPGERIEPPTSETPAGEAEWEAPEERRPEVEAPVVCAPAEEAAVEAAEPGESSDISVAAAMLPGPPEFDAQGESEFEGRHEGELEAEPARVRVEDPEPTRSLPTPPAHDTATSERSEPAVPASHTLASEEAFRPVRAESADDASSDVTRLGWSAEGASPPRFEHQSPPIHLRDIAAAARLALAPAREPAEPSIEVVEPPPARPGAPADRISSLRQLARTGLRAGAYVLAGYFAAVAAFIAVYRFVDPPFSTLMAWQWLKGEDIRQEWVPLERISPNLIRAVVVSEDGRFCQHWGVDLRAVKEAIQRARGGMPRGASTISMQVAKNVFLWPSKSYVRKAIEVPVTLAMELVWPKRRILEVYLNVAEWGPGVFGAEAASRFHFNKPATRLGEREAAQLAASLPNPIRRDAGDPGPRTARKAGVIQARARASGEAADCVLAALEASRAPARTQKPAGAGARAGM